MRSARITTSAGLAVIAVVAMTAATLVAPGGRRAEAVPRGAGARQPNVVVVMADDMRFDEMDLVADLRPGGGFDWVRAHGTRFERGWSTNNLCCPGRATYLTGQTSFNNGVYYNTPYADLENTLPRWMQVAGYCTGFTGKYMNTYSEKRPRPRGWTFWEPLTRRYDLEHGFSILRRDGKVAQPARFITDELARVSRAQLRDCLDRGKPAFINFFPYAPHFRSSPKPIYKQVDVPWSPSDPSFDEGDISDKPAWLQATVPTTIGPIEYGPVTVGLPEVAATVTRTNVHTLLSVDDGLRALIDDLRRRDELDNTLVVLTSDNGFLHFEHRLEGKQLAYEAAQPGLWIAGPGFPRNEQIDAYSTNLDLAPTIARAGHADSARRRERWDGRPLQAVVADANLGHDRFLPIFVPDVDGERGPQPEGHGVRTWRYKYVQYVDGSEELYDLAQDPYELDSRAADPASAAIKSAMQSLLEEAMACAGPACRTNAPAQLR